MSSARPRFAAVLLATLAALAGCAGAPQPAPPALRQIALLNQRGVELHRHGDAAGAARLFEQALRQARAVEHEDGIAQGLLNLARVRLQQGMPEQAEAALDALVTPSGLSFPPARRAEALLHKTTLALQRRELDAAARWQAQALGACAHGCALQPSLLNLGARIAFERGDARAALDQAQAALARHRAAANQVEAANALRLVGAARLALGAPLEARRALLEALELDKGLALSDKIHQDLVLLGHAEQGAARRAYWLRAREVARAAGLARAQAETDTLLAAPSAPSEPPRSQE